MSETEQKQAAASGKTLKSNVGYPVTLYGQNKGEVVRLLPTQTTQVDNKLLASLQKNKATKTFFDSGEVSIH